MPQTTVTVSGPAVQRVLPLWAAAAGASACLVTAIDAVLLQQKKAFFTGGFLTTAYTRTVAEAAGFIGASLLIDAAAAGLLVAVALWITGRLRLTPAARVLLGFAAGTLPLLVADFLAYRLASYLGSAFDLSLMFDLTGRRPSEFFAVAAGHLGSPARLAALAVAATAALVWIVNRRSPARRTPAAGTRAVLGWSLLLCAAATVLTASLGAASETFEDGLQRKPAGRFFGSLAAIATDVDRDGYGAIGSPGDPDPFNAAIHPYALDLPGDGIDQDGIGGDLPAGAPAYSEDVAARPWLARPNVVLVVLESFRADAVGRVIDGKPVTPVLDALARQGVSAAHAFSHNGYTAQSRFHIFSGSLADLRGHRTLIDDFKAHGYEIAYFSGQDDSFGGPRYAVGFDRADAAYDARQDRDRRYSTFATAGSLAVPFGRVQEKIAGFLAHRDRTRPLFLYVNFEDTHYPYFHEGVQPIVSETRVPESAIDPAHARDVQAMYYNMAANVDRAVGKTIAMASASLGAAPAVIVTGDHGESLFDEGFLGHGYALNDVQTRIPLIVRGLPVEIAEPFGQADLRDAIGAALATDESETGGARVSRPPGKFVFQYLGTIDRPRQIAFVTNEGRLVYDLRTDRVRLPDGAWRRPRELEGAAADAYRRLVQYWERMMLARASGS